MKEEGIRIRKRTGKRRSRPDAHAYRSPTTKEKNPREKKAGQHRTSRVDLSETELLRPERIDLEKEGTQGEATS
jgi:hypothetical protein